MQQINLSGSTELKNSLFLPPNDCEKFSLSTVLHTTPAPPTYLAVAAVVLWRASAAATAIAVVVTVVVAVAISVAVSVAVALVIAVAVAVALAIATLPLPHS